MPSDGTPGGPGGPDGVAGAAAAFRKNASGKTDRKETEGNMLDELEKKVTAGEGAYGNTTQVKFTKEGEQKQKQDQDQG